MESEQSFYHGLLATENQFNLELPYKGDKSMNEIISTSADLVALRTIPTVQPISNHKHQKKVMRENMKKTIQREN